MLTRDREFLYRHLSMDVIWAGYAICDLEEPEFQLADWFASTDAVVLRYRGLQLPLIVPFGAPHSLPVLLRAASAQGGQFYLNYRQQEQAAMRAIFHEVQTASVLRMHLQQFRPVPSRSVPLHAGDLPELLTVYAEGGGPEFSPRQLETGCFRGIDCDGQLVSVAGIHQISRRYGIATVGNVATRHRYRGRGFATACTSAVVAHLLQQGIGTILLNVDEANTAACHVYTQLGFAPYCRYTDAVGRI